MKLSSALLALALLPLLAPLPTVAQEKTADKTEKASAPTAESHDIHSYRLLYTLTEMEAGKKVGEQHFAMLNNPGSAAPFNVSSRQSMIRIGSKIPINTGPPGKTDSQFQYMDVGLTINANLNVVPNGIQISSQVDQSSLGNPTSSVPGQPVIRQTSLTSTVILNPGGHIQLGSLDIPGSTHHTDVDLTLERVN